MLNVASRGGAKDAQPRHKYLHLYRELFDNFIRFIPTMAPPKTCSLFVLTLTYCLWVVVAIAEHTAPTSTEAINRGVLQISNTVEHSNAYLPTTDSILPRPLYETNECPLDPKPMCEDPSCQGIMGTAFEQYTCSNQSPVHLLGRAGSVILSHCRCCPHLLVSCTDISCAAAPETNKCTAEPLQECICQTQEGRRKATHPDPEDRGSGPYLQPNNPPPYLGEDIVRLLGEFHQMGVFITRNETILQQMQLAGIDRPRPAGVMPNSSTTQESVTQDVTHLQSNASNGDTTHQGVAEDRDIRRTLVSFQAVLPTAVGGCGSYQSR